MSAAHWFIERRQSGWSLHAWPGDLNDMGRRIFYAYGMSMRVAIHVAFAFGAKIVWHNLPDGQSSAYFPPNDPSSQ